MCILQSVGRGGVNNRDDVTVVQVMLNENLGRLSARAPLSVDGSIGPNTQNAISDFQQQVMGMAQPDGKIEPGDATLNELRAGMAAGLNPNKLRGIMCEAVPANVEKYFNFLLAMMANAQINTPLRMAHFLAQVGHESADLHYCEELADGSAYEGRSDLGNTQEGDGVRFKGRGLIQLTGRNNYTRYGAERNRDFITDPNSRLLASDPELAVDASCWFWTIHGLNRFADADDINSVTYVINGGYNGLPQRQAHLNRAKFFMGL